VVVTMTINQAAEQRERDRILNELRSQRAAKASELEKLDQKIENLSDADFKQRLGDRSRSQMSVKERSEVVAKVGVSEYLQLDW
jgi:flagellar motility protein MotE (MotC chaperone)